MDKHLPTCPSCRAIYAERKPPELPPCKSCRVELQVENEDIAQVYMLTRRQYVTAETGRIVDISIPAVKIVMDLMGVADQKDCLDGVRSLFFHFLEKK